MSLSMPRLVLAPLFRQCKPRTRTSVRHSQQNVQHSRCFNSPSSLQQESYVQRYGTANEPQLPPPADVRTPLPAPENVSQEQHLYNDNTKQSNSSQLQGELANQQPDEGESNETIRLNGSSDIDRSTGPNQEKRSKTPLDIVMSAQPPPTPQQLEHDHDGSRPPHLTAPPYVHHFDTFSLVRDLAKGGLTDAQSTTIMKGVRTMLANNLDVARDSLVSKSDHENETYLFNAACSELRTSLQTSRQSEVQRQRTNRAQLQHEHDILNQRVSQEMMSLREELKGLFNDRKMASQEEKRKLDGKIQQLNYEITVLLNSDVKSEVEGLRWVLTRRAALALAAAAFMIISSLNYSSHLNREREEAEKRARASRKAAEKAQSESRAGTRDGPMQSEQQVSYEESLG